MENRVEPLIEPFIFIKMIQTYTLPLGPLSTNAYLLIPEQGDGAWIVDAPDGTCEQIEPLLKKHGRYLKGVLLTHGHWDHMQGLSKLREQGAKVYAHADTAKLICDPMQTQGIFVVPGATVAPAKVDFEPKQGDTIDLGGERCEVLEVPGHCPGSLAFYFPDSKFVFTGDALFAGSVGRADLPGGDWDTLQNAIRTRLYPLPDDVIVYPGHGPESTIGNEKRFNPFVRG